MLDILAAHPSFGVQREGRREEGDDMDAEESAAHPEADHDAAIERGALQSSVHGQATPDGGTATRWWRQTSTLPRPVVAAGVLALVVLAALAVLPGGGGQLAALFVHPAPTATAVEPDVPTPVPATPTPSPFPTPTLVAPPLGAIPDNCAPSPTGPAIGGYGGNTIIYAAGSGPVWVNGFDGRTAIISITLDADGPYTQYGWPVFAWLAVKFPFNEVVTLRGSDLRTSAPLWFTTTEYGPETFTPLLTVNPLQSTVQWWNGTMWLPGAGCYSLQASWQGGGWRITLAAGR
jgi:hypothetical protein